MNMNDITKKAQELYTRLSNWASSSFNIKEKDFQLALYIVIIILFNIAGATLNFRCDLTRNNTYSLSDKSREVVSGLKETFRIKVLFSQDLPAQHASVQRYLIDLLNEYSFYGNRYFNYEIIPEKDLERIAGDYGITPVQSQELASDQVKIRRTYMGLVFQQADLIEKMNAVTNTVGLEYEISSNIQKMSNKIDGLLKLKDPLKLKLFVDARIRQLPIDGMDKLDNSLQAAVDKSNKRNYDKIRFELIDPSIDNKTDEFASTYGLQKIQWGPGVTAKGGGPLTPGVGLLGIVLEGNGKFEVVDLRIASSLFGNNVITGLDTIEEKINDAVGRMVSTSPGVGYITGHEEADIDDERNPAGAGVIMQLLKDQYEVKKINLASDEISQDIQTIIVNGPREKFTDYELFKLDQFLMKGRSVVFFIDSFYEMNMQGQQGMMNQQPPVLPVETGLDDILRSYGVTVNKDIVMDVNCANLNLGQMMQDVNFLPIVTQDGLSSDNVITKFLKGIAFFKASTVTVDPQKVKKGGPVKTDLVTSSSQSWLQTGRINFNPIIAGFEKPKDTMKSYSMAVLLEGNFESFFKGKEVPKNEVKEDEDKKGAEEKKAEPAPGPITSVERHDATIKSGKSRILVVGTSEIAKSGFIMNSQRLMSKSMSAQGEGGSANGIFIRNIVDYLNGNTYIPEMRTKSLDFNPLSKTSDTARFVYKGINTAGVPILVVIAGIVIWRRRLARRKKLFSEFSGEGAHE